MHLIWLWMWFLIGAFAYMAKRGYYLVKGPNPVAQNWKEFFKVATVPMGFRLLVESGIYWACFAPEVIQAALSYFGWSMASSILRIVTQFAVCALFFGLAIDSIVDWLIGTVVSKIPFLKDWWPQMPPPLTATGQK